MTTLKAQSISVSTQELSLALIQIIGMATLTALCAHARFYLPFTPVPITLQSFAVIMSGALLGSKKGLASQAVLLTAGALGLDVFSTNVGASAFLGASGGYLLGFLLSAYVAGRISEQRVLRGFLSTNGYLFLASMFIFIPGIVWLKVFTHSSWWNALQMGFFPFLAGDVIKTLMATTCLKLLRR